MNTLPDLIPLFNNLIAAREAQVRAFDALDTVVREQGFYLYFDEEEGQYSLRPLPKVLESNKHGSH